MKEYKIYNQGSKSVITLPKRFMELLDWLPGDTLIIIPKPKQDRMILEKRTKQPTPLIDREIVKKKGDEK